MSFTPDAAAPATSSVDAPAAAAAPAASAAPAATAAAKGKRPAPRAAAPAGKAPKATAKAVAPKAKAKDKPKAPKTAPVPAPTAAAAAPKGKEKLVRDSFTMPRADFDLIDLLKERALGFKHPAKKSELLRAGLQALAALDDAALQARLSGLTALKAGRPKKQG
ncbi:hypothetical protein V4F39_14070 [Aquincola sp. MAHUQ-54]|uniref:Uncharacterized protein n=1 Tax=Aquincola agrisoli TaxID=3119538 RepID=A0AAW9QHB9_9BURK